MSGAASMVRSSGIDGEIGFNVSDAIRALSGTPYAEGFASGSLDDPFLDYYAPAPAGGERKTLERCAYTRRGFLELACRCAHALRARGVASARDAAAHWFTGNAVEDLAARLAAVILRTTLVTINWQGDSAERVAYKVQATSAKVLLVDSGVPADELAKVLELLGAGVQLLRATEIASFAPALPPSEPASEPSGRGTL
ncbi:hypothetical protein T492DRAFT_910732 [Pavlovales sp. CCMP2436]|nr:hypothetical protein T492DRAFT_910732 [Pavlovales sp. CCMP2436]